MRDEFLCFRAVCFGGKLWLLDNPRRYCIKEYYRKILQKDFRVRLRVQPDEGARHAGTQEASLV